jgi:hypothetical protein
MRLRPWGYSMLVNDDKEASLVYPQILHPGTRALFRFWEKIRGENAAPGRDDLDLKQISDIVPNLLMLERDYLHQTYKWRLAGSQTSLLYRQPLTNTNALAGWSGFERNTMKHLLDSVVTSLQPCLFRIRLITDTDQAISAELLGLPVRARNGMRFHVFGGVFPFRDISNLVYDSIKYMELSGARAIWTEPLPGDKLAVSQRSPDTRPRGLHLIKGGRA